MDVQDSPDERDSRERMEGMVTLEQDDLERGEMTVPQELEPRVALMVPPVSLDDLVWTDLLG